jgi:dTDP-4-amino-4,6-dideoxygalactose transaminase
LTDSIPFLAPTFPPVEEVAEVFAEVARSGTFSNGGPAADRFGAGLAGWLDIGPDRISIVANATIGLQLAMGCLFDRGRRYVLVASFTFASGPLMILQNGFSPLFVDIDPDTWQPSLEWARRHLADHRPAVAGILLTDTFGVANEEVDGWEALASEYGVPLVIDAASGFGSTFPDGRPVGRHGDCVVFSFHATKTLAVGEGGAVVARDPALARLIDRSKNFGFDDDRECVVPGTNGKLDELSCGIGSLQLAVLDDRLRERRSIFRRYRDRLAPIGAQFQPSAAYSAIPFVSVTFATTDVRDRVRDALDRSNIGVRTYYNPPVHRQPVFRCHADRPLPVTDDIAGRILSLPVGSRLATGDVERICDVIHRSIG